jgi:hypothetical protein
MKQYTIKMFIDEALMIKSVSVDTREEAKTLVDASNLCGWSCVVYRNNIMIIL